MYLHYPASTRPPFKLNLITMGSNKPELSVKGARFCPALQWMAPPKAFYRWKAGGDHFGAAQQINPPPPSHNFGIQPFRRVSPLSSAWTFLYFASYFLQHWSCFWHTGTDCVEVHCWTGEIHFCANLLWNQCGFWDNKRWEEMAYIHTLHTKLFEYFSVTINFRYTKK